MLLVGVVVGSIVHVRVVMFVAVVLVSHVAVYHGFDVVSYGVVLCDIVVGCDCY